MSKNEAKVQWSGMPTNDATLKEIKGAIENTYEQYRVIAEAKDNLKDIFDDIHARTGMPRRVFNFLAKTNFKGDAYETIHKNNELEEAHDALSKVTI